MLQFKSLFIKTDVTALKVHKNFTFIGIGATLHIFSNKNKELINKVNIEDIRGEQIFGIEPFSHNKILVYGGQFLLLFQTYGIYTLEEIHRTAHTDWILEAKLIDNDTKIATVSMQNKLQIWDNKLKLIEIFDCEEQCILYSAHICYKKYEDLIVLSGTVFNEVLVWKIPRDPLETIAVIKRLKKHEGVIFSLYYNEENGLICSTSDDRSAVLWKAESCDLGSELNRKIPNIFPVCQVYGHLSRVFRCLILEDCFVTAGEDSLTNIWTLDGKLKRKVETNQGSPIWAVGYNKKENILITGGGNGGVYAFSLNFVVQEEKLCLPGEERPKLVGILASNNFVVFSENGSLFLNVDGEWVEIKFFEDLKNYVVLKVSRCRKMLALAGFNGQVYIYKEFKETLQHICNFQSTNTSRIISLHWLNCNMLVICQNDGKLTLLHLKPQKLTAIASFILPRSSQRCSTTAAMFEDTVIVGDRRGNIHRYKLGTIHPIQTIKRIHSHLGITNLVVNNNKLISLGRNSTVKTFLTYDLSLTLVTCDKVPYNWLLDIADDLLIAFSGNNFVVWNCRTKRIVLEKVCGGGHRSWDFTKTDQITFMYIKDKFVNRFDYDLNVNKSYDLIESFHLKEVNTMQIIQANGKYLLISGGEDTTLRITQTNAELNSFTNLLILKSHLSSIRCIATFKLVEGKGAETHLIFSAGGRAQVICWTLDYCLKNNVIDNLMCQENYSYYEAMDCEYSETRIMDLCPVDIKGEILLFGACSDGFIKLFYVVKDDVFSLKLYRNIFYKLKCIFKLLHISILERDVLVTLASDGNLVFWNINDFFSPVEAQPFSSIPVHQSGINSVSKLQSNSDTVLFLTAGDDNVVVLSYLKFDVVDESLTVRLVDSCVNAGLHWAQITGTFICNQYFLSASVDQRLILYKWRIEDERVVCEAVTKYNSSIADLKGLVCFDDGDFDVFIYGLGVEFLKLVNK